MGQKKEMDKKGIIEHVAIPEGCSATSERGIVTVKGKNGECTRKFQNKDVSIAVEGNMISIRSEKTNANVKKMVYTFKAHLANMVKGASKGHNYSLKICSGHFPMNVSVSNNQLIVKNFYGEKFPRALDIKPGVTVKVEGEIITVESADKEAAGQCAGSIEQLTRRVGFDLRIFQDGIYITNKSRK